MKRIAAALLVAFSGGSAAAQTQQIEADVTVHQAKGLIDWSQVSPRRQAPAGNPMADALRASADRMAQQRQFDAQMDLERQRLQLERERFKADSARPPAATPAPTPQSDPTLTLVATWSNGAKLPFTDGTSAILKLDEESIRALGGARLFRWGIISGEGKAAAYTGVMDCAAKTVDPAWPVSKIEPVLPGSGWARLFSRLCAPPATAAK